MTSLLMDGYDHYGTGAGSKTNLLAGPYSQINGGATFCGSPTWGPPRTGSACFGQFGSNETGTPCAWRVLPATKTHLFLSFGFAVDSFSAIGENNIVCFGDASQNILFQLKWTTTGALQVVAGNGTVLSTSSGPVIVTQNWHFMEMEVDSSAHTFTLRVDDASAANTPIMSVTNSLITGTMAQIGLLSGANGTTPPPSSFMDDLFVRDSSGTINNSWLGDRRIATLFADDDTSTAGWSGRYYEMLGTGILNVTASTFGNGACLGASTSTSLDIGSHDFTLESFVRFQALPTGTDKSVIFSRWDETNNQRSYQLFLGSVGLNNGSLCFQTSTDGSNSTISQPVVYPWTPETDTWYHIAMVRAAGELLLFVNGQQLGLPIADTSTYFTGASPLGIAGEVYSDSGLILLLAGTTLQGWIDETRFTNGFARYTSNFTPTTVEFPRTSGGDPEWADVVYLAGYDTIIQDESSFGRALTAINGAVQQTVRDGPSIGVWSTLGKPIPDDNTFAEAPFLPATSVLTLSAQPAASDTVTVGTTDGTTAAVYTFKSSVSSAYDVLIDTSLQQTLQNLYNAINAGPGSGTKYGTSTLANFDVNALQLPAGQMAVSANRFGSSGNSIATSVSLTHGGAWTGTTLAGGADIPGPSNFKLQRLPPDTTLISAVQVTTRSFKSDAGTGTMNTALVGPLGTVATGSTHALTVSPVYYEDIYETDPDTSGPISPTTLTNGSVQINRDT